MGLRLAVSAGVDHGLAAVELGEDRAGPVPPALLAQAQQAARQGVALNVLLRRYFAAYTLFGDFIMRATEDAGQQQGTVLRRAMHSQTALFERLVLAVLDEYARANADAPRRPGQRKAEAIKRLLAGESVVDGELEYEFDDWHVGAVACGDGAMSTLRDLASAADRRLLLVQPEAGTVWAWFAGRRRVGVAEIVERVTSEKPGDSLVALGEPARGLDGWRLTHQQATAALRVGRQRRESVVRYADVGLLASISRDRVLARSLRQLYLAPLADARDGGADLRETLRAYFKTGRNVSSAASALGVSRQTVGSRLRVVEEKLGRTLESCAPELEVALKLDGSG